MQTIFCESEINGKEKRNPVSVQIANAIIEKFSDSILILNTDKNN